MGKPLMLRDEDDKRIEALKAKLGAPTKIAVVRAGLDLLEHEALRAARIKRSRRAVHLVAAESRRVNAEFRSHSRLKRT
jgi:hypothetical protein|tara:strand:- start:371 stop:607 length:237 start_codon:yes stop_codon:yes gene_type:complete